MKKLLFILLTFLSFSAFCQTPSPKFTDAYADRVNSRVTNLIIKSPSGTVEIHHSGSIVDSSAVNNHRMQQYVQNQLSGFSSIDSARVYDSLSVHRDSIDAISSYAHGLSQDFWPLEGNFSIPTQIITLTGNTSFQRGGTNQFRLTSVLNDFRTPDGLNILSFTNALTTYTAGNGIPLRYGSEYSIGNDLDIIPKGYADSNVRGLSIPVTTSQAGNSIRIDGSGTQWEYYTPSSGGVSEAYVATSVDSVRSELADEIEVTSAEWTPEPTAAAISDGVSFVTLTSCRYVRLGGMVTINGLIRVSANTSTEFAEVEGLPFTISGTSYNFPLNAFIGSTFLEARGNLDGSGNQLQIVEGSANAFLTWQDLAGSWFTFQVTYKTND